jgi:hypothetical protein
LAAPLIDRSYTDQKWGFTKESEMPLSLNELTGAMSAAARAAGQSASNAGKDLTGDVERFVLPQMEGIASQIIAIEAGRFDQGTAKLLMSMEINHVSSVICSVSELVALEVQNIINAALQAVAALVNTSLRFTLL